MPRTRGPRRILGNLDAEADLALLPTRWRPRPAGRRITLSRAALDTLSGAATLLRVFSHEGDRLWTPAPVDPERLAEVPGLPRPVLESGPLDALPPAAAVLAWAETPQVVEHRGPAPVGLPRLEDRLPFWEIFWNLRPASPAVVATVHHRAHALEMVRRLGCSLPGARIVASLAELEAHLQVQASEREPGPWVVKACLSAAGRARHVERSSGPELSPEARVRVARLLSLHGPLLCEPWMDRVEDLGCAILLFPDEVWLAGFHRQVVDGEGRFRGIELSVDRRPPDPLLASTVVQVSELLDQEGYRGPFGIDAFVHRLPGGTVALHPLGEINARMTFGLVARALVDRLREPLGLDPGGQIRLLFGPQIPEVAGIVPLLLPGKGRAEGAAWLETSA